MTISENKPTFSKIVTKAELIDIFVDYLLNHTYVNGKHIASDYLNITYYPSYSEKQDVRKLKYKLNKLFLVAKNLGYIEKYNSNVYKVIKTIDVKKLTRALVRKIKNKPINLGAKNGVESSTN